MKKISTLFKKDPNNLAGVINEVDPENNWALHSGIATRKFDGTACAVIEGELYKRYDVKKGREIPANAIPCQEPDGITGHWPHWVKCDSNDKSDKYHFEAFDKCTEKIDGTYELVGPKIQSNPEGYNEHRLIVHGGHEIKLEDRSFESIRDFLSASHNDIEGIVFHANDGTGRMCKIRKSDFDIKRKK
ncbi:hypothetical protein [Mucilaginibacter xinganensis]|uniref:Uncharacterized protein n=1 Tax=Mucilaginibacter xinganensis TaxID=1234841 RepID=A0A223NUK9_9SPHI|nr:hypothetical protein [Mucilaginibacter xinganensis]ASU33440.1 hypothetical protein MuYL_1542 [Mucilaginibacter xinganensis]